MKTQYLIAVSLMVGLGLPGAPARAEGLATPPVIAQAAEMLVSLTQVGPLMQVVATEGARHGMTLEASLFPGRGGDAWGREVARIQEPDRLTGMVHASLEDMLRPEDAQAAVSFFTTDLGQRIVEREVDARRAMLDDSVEAGALTASATLAEAETPRARLIAELIEALDLIASNVSGGMNANFAFYRGLADGGALAERLPERELLALVQAQEDEIRVTAENWLRAYLMMAYAPLSDDDLAQYVAFAETPAGRRYNAAVFDGFGRVFEATSYDLGRAAARFMVQSDI